ncbi:hypothetical protein [Dinghuibacter silviterrae]|uniref:Uncharacterized protein n=1 Tax=Dinghuibacter silviterrae TaxID=1539049 RepID=A0A4R8DUM1_9BACT|nr:hypothetical protein [Dinghuibacter silviterrae]TDX01869.1 hypothetical protein EDB95_2913 [Dinghuibacter silviterrae]
MALIQATQPLVPLTMNMDKVFLTVTIGNFQIGASAIWFDGGPLLTKGDISQFLLGKKVDLLGKKLWIVTTVLDSNPADGNIIVTIGFNGTTSAPIVVTAALNAGDIYALTTSYTFN